MAKLNTQATQFYVAVVGVVGLVLLTARALICSAFVGEEKQVVDNVLLLLVGGLVSGVGTSIAYLFRLNGQASGKSGGSGGDGGGAANGPQ